MKGTSRHVYLGDSPIASRIIVSYGLLDCTWEPAENFANDSSKINEFLDWWATENPTVDMEFLDPKETIFIRDAYNYARQGVEWPGAS